MRDLVAGLTFGKPKCGELESSKFDVFNLAPDGATSVRFIVGELLSQLGARLKPATATPRRNGRDTVHQAGYQSHPALAARAR
ncbi:MAG TPA: hypothetical protein VGY98_02315 [Verrucomicrobiae bacterium]|nr:hypothetical protein [Verrucomicrobiae bacterium]